MLVGLCQKFSGVKPKKILLSMDVLLMKPNDCAGKKNKHLIFIVSIGSIRKDRGPIFSQFSLKQAWLVKYIFHDYDRKLPPFMK